MAMLESKIEKLIDQQSELKQRSDQQAGLIKKLKEKVAEQENENVLQRTEIHRLQKNVQVLNNRIQQLQSSKIDCKVTEVKAAVLRTCEEIRRSDPTRKSGTYLIDPDGDAFGDPPVTVYCNMTTGKVEINWIVTLT
jgi:predicted nuclease with TOPRIM domain